MMNFSGEGSEEVKRLKKQLHQQDFRLSNLQVEKQKDAAQIAALTHDIHSLRQRSGADEAKIAQLEAENAKNKDDRAREKVAFSNIEQAYTTIKLQLQGKEKDKRLFDDEHERNLERRARLAESEAESAKERCRILEEQVRSAQASERFHDTTRRKSGESEVQVTALQNEIITLKSRLEQHQHTSSPATSRPGGPSRRPRSSSVSGSSSSETHQLRESLNESIKEVEQLKARATKAEKEALKVSNEKLASTRLSETTIADLRSQVSDLKDEVSFQRDNLLKKLEDEIRSLKADSVKASRLEAELQAARSSSLQQEALLKAAQDTIATWQGTADQLKVELAQAKKQGDRLKEQLITAEKTAKQLQRRDREVESAKKRINKLSVALRKVLVTVTNGQAAGDETHSQSLLAVDEITFANVTTTNDYEADLLDEIDQLLGYVDEADDRVEFAKVERGISESNAISQRRELDKIIQLKENELIVVKEERDRHIAEQEEGQIRMREIQSKKEEMELRLQGALGEMKSVSADNEVLRDHIESLRASLSSAEKDLKQTAEDRLVLLDTIKQLENVRDERQKQLAESVAEVRRTEVESDGLHQLIAKVKLDLHALENERDDLIHQLKDLKVEREGLETQLNDARSTVDELERKCQEAKIQTSRLLLSIHDLELSLHDQAKASSQRQADLLEQSLSALHLESNQWSSLVAELRQDVEQSFLHLQSKERSWTEEADRQSIRIAALEAEATVAREELQKTVAQVDILQLNLQAGRTNQQLAEDALTRLVPGRETDLTVLDDVSSLDASQEANDLRLQLDQTRDALESSKRRQSARESDLAVALEEAEELKSELDRLDQELNEAHRQKEDMLIEGQDLQEKLLAAETLNSELQATVIQLDSNLSSTMRQLAATQNTFGELEATLQCLEMEKTEQTRQSEAVREELREAQEGYQMLKELMESRNAEYWETKEELAEWQERFERSQNDVKVKDEIEERLREVMSEMDDAKALADEYLAKCTVLEEGAAVAQKEIEESRSQYDSLIAEMKQKNMQESKLQQVEQELGAATALIEQLEQDLAQKAQECEDADDKELALRKDNKKLGARVAALQARIDKLQLQSSTSKATATSQSNKAPVSQIRESGSAGSITSALQAAAASSSISRKRRAPEDEEQSMQSERHPAVTTRAIYAPKSATNLVKEGAVTKMSSFTQSVSMQRTMVKKASFPPSEALANRLLKSPKKVANSTLQDRTNLLQPRQATAAVQDNHFLTKLNRFRPPTIQIEAAPIAPS